METGNNEVSNYDKIALACDRLAAEGKSRTTRNVQAKLKSIFGSGNGVRAEKISDLIGDWEKATGNARREARESARAPAKSKEPVVTADDVVERHPDVQPVLDLVAGALQKLLDQRDRNSADDRRRAVEAEADRLRLEHADHLKQIEADHAADIADRDALVADLRSGEEEMLAELEELRAKEGTRQRELEMAMGALEDTRLTVDRQKIRIGELELAQEQELQARRKAEDAAAKLRAEIEQLRRDLSAAQQAKAAAEADKAQMGAIVEGLRGDVADERRRNDGLQERITELASELAVAKAQIKPAAE